ncbi:DNA-binding bromodomain-containing protein [Zea mays]|nr:DNA-binding bromodomain-containing protein [Zea mays]
MQYNAPDTIYFRQAHSIQELARKKFQELRDEGIPTENPIKSEQKSRPNFCSGEQVKKPVLRYLDDDLDFLSRKDQDKRSNSNNVNDDMSFNGHVKKTLSKNAPDQSCLLQKERINKPISRNSEDNLSSSFHKKQRKKLISRHSEDDLNCPSGRDRARKVISKNSENDENSPFHKHQVKKSAPQRSIDGLSFQEKHIKKPIDGNGEDPGFSSCKRRIEDPFCTNVEDASFSSTKRLSEKPMSEKPISINKEEDLDHCHQESSKKPSCRVEQDDHGYSCDEEAVKKPGCMDSHDAQGSDISAATIASVGDGSNGLSMPQPNNSEPTGCTVANGVIDKDISSPLDEIRSEKTDDILAKPSYKTIVVDENRRKTYDASEGQSPMESDPVFDVFSAEPKELVNVGLDAEHSYAYARSLARFAGSFGAQGWRIASDRIRQALPADVKYGRGWVGEYEPPLLPILVVNDQPRYLKSSETNRQRNASLPRDNERLRSTETNNPKDMRRMTTDNNVVGVPGQLDSPEFKPRLFGVSNELQHRSTGTLSLHENHRVSGNVAKTKRTTNEKTRKGTSSSSARPREMQLQKGASSGALDNLASNKMAGQPRPFLQPPESNRTQPMRKIDSSKNKIPIEMAPQQVECAKGAASGVHDTPLSDGQPKHFFQSQAAASSGVHDMHSSNGQPKHYFQSQAAASSDMHAMPSSNGQPKHYFKSHAAVSSVVHDMPSSNGQPKQIFQSQAVASSGGHDMPSNGQSKPLFQSQEATILQPKNEATWVYHGRPGDGKVGTSNKSRPSTSIGFINKNHQSVNAATFAMNLNGQKIVSDHAKSAGTTAMPVQVNIPNRGLDAPRNMFSAFPAAVRENHSIPPAPMAQSWISFGATTENKPTIVSPTSLDNNCGWKMPFANVQPSDDTKINAVPQLFRHPVQVARENSVQSKGLVIFPQLVQPDFARSQGQPQWQGLVPHMQQKPGKDVLRPDLNIGFPSPRSPPARQSSGINLEAQQPDLALQL